MKVGVGRILEFPDQTMSEHPESDNQSTERRGHLTNRQAYNVVSDLAMGANVRFKANVFQAIAIGACLLLGGDHRGTGH